MQQAGRRIVACGVSVGFSPPGGVAKVMAQLGAERTFDERFPEPPARRLDLLRRHRPVRAESIQQLNW